MSTVEELFEFAKNQFSFEPLEGVFNSGVCLSGFVAEGGPRLLLIAGAGDEGFIDAFAVFADSTQTQPEDAIARVGMNCRLGLQLLGPFYALRTYFEAETTTIDSFVRELALLHSAAKRLTEKA